MTKAVTKPLRSFFLEGVDSDADADADDCADADADDCAEESTSTMGLGVMSASSSLLLFSSVI